MKKDGSVSISGSGKENSKRMIRLIAVIVLLAALLGPVPCRAADEDLNTYTIDDIFFKFHNRIEPAPFSHYHPLLFFKRGDLFNYKKIREAAENLYKVGSFANIETRVVKKPGKKLDVYLVISEKYKVHSIRLRQLYKANDIIHIMPLTSLKKKELENIIFSLRKGDYFEEEKLADMVKEVKAYLTSQGYFKPAVTFEVTKDHRRLTAIIKLLITPGIHTSLRDVKLTVTPTELRKPLETFFAPYLDGGTGSSGSPVSSDGIENTANPGGSTVSGTSGTSRTGGTHTTTDINGRRRAYIPTQFQQTLEKVKRFLVLEKYYFPEISVKEQFPEPGKPFLNLDITIDAGYKYIIQFEGIKNKMPLIASLWEKKVFEKWAVKESKARILYHLKNKGHFNAEVKSRTETDKNVKTITFSVNPRGRYTLGKIFIEGNQAISREELLKLIEVDDLVFDRYFHLRFNKLLLDQEILRLYYFSKGYPTARVSTETAFRGKRADIRFKIDEGKKFTVDSVLFEGNRFFNSQTLTALMQTRANKPFVQQTLHKDLETLNRIYHSYGFDNIDIEADVSQGTEKSILVKIKEGKRLLMGNLIIIGASANQRKLLERLFPIKPGQPYNQLKADAFKTDIENSSIFNQFRIIKIRRDADRLDILVKVNPDNSVFYGFGIGWEERKGMRGTLEYQERNFLSTYSTFSAMIQYGKNEKRGLLSYDTPYFLNTHMSTALKLWYDNEIYPSYKFDRFGLSETLIKRLNPYSYLMASLSWYRTTLTDLEITPQGVDQLDVPFDTTALSLSYVQEKRNDPFNPSEGSFFSSDLKIGLPLFEKDYSFVKLRCSYQKIFKILKNGIFSTSIRSGVASGDMSITERFFAGGIKTFRGTNRDQLSPMDPVTQHPLGGNAMVLFNFETTFPLEIFPVSDFYYAVFADVGNVFGKVKEFSLGQLKTAIGISLQYKTSMGPLRFDIAWNIETGKPKFHLGIGNVF